jgi:hypothetical protein
MKAFQANLSTLFFESCERATSSDHKPVRAGFSIVLTKGTEDILVDHHLLSHRPSAHAGNVASDPIILRLRLSDMKGYNLEEMDSQMFGGGSDPYVVVTTDPPSLLLRKGRVVTYNEGVRSSVIKHDLNPVWKDVLSLQLASVDVTGLSKNASLIISVWDEDTYNADDLIGVVSLPLKDILTSLLVDRKPYAIDSVLRSNSEIMGRYTATLSLDGPVSEVLELTETVAKERAHPPQLSSHARFISLALMEVETAQGKGGCCSIA